MPSASTTSVSANQCGVGRKDSKIVSPSEMCGHWEAAVQCTLVRMVGADMSRMTLFLSSALIIAVVGGCSVADREVGGASSVPSPRMEASGNGEDPASTRTYAESACSEASTTFPEEGIPHSESMSLTAAYGTDAASMAGMDASLAQSQDVSVTSPWEDRPPETALILCFFDGELGPSRGPYDPDRPDYDRIVVVLEEGARPFLARAGFGGVIDIVDPNEF